MLGYNTFYFKLIALIVSSITAAFAGLLHTIHAPIVSPEIAGLEWTVAALLMILIGGVGTLSGAYVGALIFGLLKHYLDRWVGGAAANFLLGTFYILLVLFIPFGIVGTLRMHSLEVRRGRDYLIGLVTGRGQASAEDK
jgi:branched-chain amino acid transport system permease protein